MGMKLSKIFVNMYRKILTGMLKNTWLYRSCKGVSMHGQYSRYQTLRQLA